jgi:hypothetical protein
VEPRKLKALLSTLAAFGVSSYEHDGLKVQFAGGLPPEPSGEVEVGEGADTSWAATIPPDPRPAIHAAYERAKDRRRGVRS